jgi:hypothetical protein
LRLPTPEDLIMQPVKLQSVNYAAISVALASVVAWLGLYALYADFASEGFDLLQHAGALAKIEGLTLLAFEAVGLLLIGALCAGLVTLAVKVGVGGFERDRRAGN